MDKKRLFYAFEKTIFLGASTHLLIILFHALRSGEYEYLSMADIFDLKLLFPSLEYTPLVTILTTLPVIGVFFYFLFIKKQKSSQ